MTTDDFLKNIESYQELDPAKLSVVYLHLLAHNQAYLREVLKNQIEIKEALKLETETFDEVTKRLDDSAESYFFELTQTVMI